MIYQVELAPAAKRQIRKLPQATQDRILDKLEELAATPRPPGAKRLENAQGLWRVRVGDYRVVYQVEDQVLMVLVVRVGHRRVAYRKLGQFS